MSAVLIRAALETALAAMSPSLGTAWENVPYEPVNGTPFQAASVLLAEPEIMETSQKWHRERGFMQVNLNYPLSTGSAAALARAELIRTTFYAAREFTSGGVTVTVDGTPTIAPARTDDEFFVVPVRVRFFAHILRS